MLYFLHDRLQNLPSALQIAGLVLPNPLEHPFFDLFKDGFNRIELGRAGRNVIKFNVLLDEHLGQTWRALGVISVYFVQIEDEVQLAVFSLDVLAEGTFLEVYEKFLDDLEKLLAWEKALLDMEKQDAVDSACQQNRNRAVLVALAWIEAATQLIHEDQGLAAAYERQHELGVVFACALVACVWVQGFYWMAYVFVAVAHLTQVPWYDRTWKFGAVLLFDKGGHLGGCEELLLL